MRGVGQTTHLIYNLPSERCMIVTPSRDIGRLIENKIKDIRGKEFYKNIKVMSINSESDITKMMGYSHPIFFDHSFFELSDERVAKKAIEVAIGASIVYNNRKRN